MKVEIDLNKLLEKIDVNKLVEEEVMTKIVDSSEIEDIMDNLLDNEETKNFINNKIIKIIGDYLNTEEGRKSVIDKFEDTLVDTDILTSEKIIDVITSFLKNKLRERS